MTDKQVDLFRDLDPDKQTDSPVTDREKDESSVKEAQKIIETRRLEKIIESRRIAQDALLGRGVPPVFKAIEEASNTPTVDRDFLFRFRNSDEGKEVSAALRRMEEREASRRNSRRNWLIAAGVILLFLALFWNVPI
jgi:hypothetical protein